jgi:hypothetical protein
MPPLTHALSLRALLAAVLQLFSRKAAFPPELKKLAEGGIAAQIVVPFLCHNG